MLSKYVKDNYRMTTFYVELNKNLINMGSRLVVARGRWWKVLTCVKVVKMSKCPVYKVMSTLGTMAHNTVLYI